jgi:rubrerythrin
MLNKWLGGQRRMSIASEETKQDAETIANEESEHERKFRTENENLTKEIVLLSQQKLELEVSQFSVWFI